MVGSCISDRLKCVIEKRDVQGVSQNSLDVPLMIDIVWPTKKPSARMSKNSRKGEREVLHVRSPLTLTDGLVTRPTRT